MNSTTTLTPEFIEFIPEPLEDGKLYVSMSYALVAHKCCCGCGEEVVTPLSPAEWKLFFDGETISLCPSIGNWNYACRSHYWVKRNKIEWASPWTQEQIDAGRKREALAKQEYFDNKEIPIEAISEAALQPVSAALVATDVSVTTEEKTPNQSWLQKITTKLFGRFFK